jgi:hypothetical protein
MEHNKAQGPDGFSAEFYETLWDIIKEYLLESFVELHAGPLDMFRICFGEIMLLPKVNDAKRNQQYTPICILNVCFKKIIKAATIRLNSVADEVVRPRLLFMQDRYILDGVVTLHETIHEMHRKNLNGIILKIDLKKPMIK